MRFTVFSFANTYTHTPTIRALHTWIISVHAENIHRKCFKKRRRFVVGKEKEKEKQIRRDKKPFLFT